MAKLIQEMITMLCGIVSLVYILRQQRIIQLQNEAIRNYRETLTLREETIRLYKEVFGMMDKQTAQLKAILLQKAGRE
ncbi:hypothetical protein [Acutalibacter sp. 1XD8-36]|uniref:hypothetical protein n=1 Tax=Acutalibacter sp. 1XD8-36 TaxID=2320852 RepID=UPI00141299C5|nr:hypothetical protein [Acutalibacter sp. 1XD8-36]